MRIQEFSSLSELHKAMRDTADNLCELGSKARILTGFEPLGDIAYVECVLEMVEQFNTLSIIPDYIFVCSGSGTQSGLEVGLRALGLKCKIIGVSATDNIEGYPSVSARLAEVANWIAERLNLNLKFYKNEIYNTNEYVGEGYGKVTQAGAEAIALMASTEGILLDPVYTGKAMAGLIDFVRRGRITPDQTVVFVHTGGSPAIFGYQKELLNYIPALSI